jgi:translation initiation factor IF-2
MPQTIEAINHAKAAGVPIIVALNKIDLPQANQDRVKQQLAEHSLVLEEWGGDVICVPVSAKTKEGIENLLENILVVAEVADLKADPDRPARGVVVEAGMDTNRGPMARCWCRGNLTRRRRTRRRDIRQGQAMFNEHSRRIKSAGPSAPAKVLASARCRCGEIVAACPTSGRPERSSRRAASAGRPPSANAAH